MKKHILSIVIIFLVVFSIAHARSVGDVIAEDAPQEAFINAVCGDGVIEGNEECEGDNLNSNTCGSYGFIGGDLSCKGCILDTSECIAPTVPAAQFTEGSEGSNLNALDIAVIVLIMVLIVGGILYFRHF